MCVLGPSQHSSEAVLPSATGKPRLSVGDTPGSPERVPADSSPHRWPPFLGTSRFWWRQFALRLPCISRAWEPSGSLGETLPQQGSCGCQRGGRARTSSDVSPGLSVTHLAPHTLRASQQQDEWSQRMGSFIFPNEFPPPFRGAESFIVCFAGTPLQLGEGRGLGANINLM